MQPSSSDISSDVFSLLHPTVQRWIWDKGWTELRDIQAIAIKTILKAETDALIAAATASGKTEAAFLPILSRLAETQGRGVRALYIGPLKALINDQFERLEDLCERLELPVTKWHGDASAAAKQRVRKQPAGIVLITPESVEALFVRRSEDLAHMFSGLEFVVIDELHAFLDSDRGVQLASLLKRLDAQAKCRPRRIGLSATLGDLLVARAWLRPERPELVAVIESLAFPTPLHLQIRGIVECGEVETGDVESSDDNTRALRSVADHLFRTLRAKGNHLVFAGSRRNTEALSDQLRVMCENAGLPNEFFPHHGNLSRDTRESLEHRLREGSVPTTAIATTTLELGIDIGSVESIAQVGAPASISSLRQRLGRSGRRAGKPAVLRIYAVEQKVDEHSSLFDRLRVETVQSIAAVRLLLDRWIEPPRGSELHLSTLLHQTLSVICERGGVSPQDSYLTLGGSGPFAAVTSSLYARLLRAMHDREQKLIEQAPDGTLMLGPFAERLTTNYDFYSVFVTYDEYLIRTGSQTLGTLSITNSLGPGDFLIFGGRRWRVLTVDDPGRRIDVEPAPAGRMPRFEGEAAPLHDRLAQEIRSVFLDDDIPVYLNAQAKEHLAEGRSVFRELGLHQRLHACTGGRIYLFPWLGSRKLDTLRLCLRYCGLAAEQGRIAISVPIGKGLEQIGNALRQLSASFPSTDALALMCETLRAAKYDYLLPDDLLRVAFARDRVEPNSSMRICGELADDLAASTEVTQ